MTERLYNALWTYVNDHKAEIKAIEAENRTSIVYENFKKTGLYDVNALPANDNAVEVAEIYQCIEDAITYDCCLELEH